MTELEKARATSAIKGEAKAMQSLIGDLAGYVGKKDMDTAIGLASDVETGAVRLGNHVREMECAIREGDGLAFYRDLGGPLPGTGGVPPLDDEPRVEAAEDGLEAEDFGEAPTLPEACQTCDYGETREDGSLHCRAYLEDPRECVEGCTERVGPMIRPATEPESNAEEEPTALHADVQALLANRTISLMALGATKNQKDTDRLTGLYPQVYEIRNAENDGPWLTTEAQLGAYRVTDPTTYAMSQDRLNPAMHCPLSTSHDLSWQDWRSRIRSCLRKLGEVGEEQALERHPEIFTACAGETILTDEAIEGRVWFRRGGRSVAREE